MIKNNFKTILIKLKGLLPLKIKTELKKFKNFNAYLGLDKKMLNYINYQNGFYIECGANDGINQSNTWFFEKKLNWKGLLIEPNPKVFEELKKNRSNKNYFSRFLITSFKKKSSFVKMIDGKDSLKNRVVNREIKNFNHIYVKCKTLNQILKDIKAPKNIDFFSLDVEGEEWNVLNGINFNTYSFKFILIETRFFKKINIFLKKFNYKFEKKLSNIDYLFKKI